MKIKYLKNIGLMALLGVVFALAQGFDHPSRTVAGRVLAAATGVSVDATTTIDSIQTQVQSLIQENTNLKNKVQQADLTAGVRRVLKRGMSGDDVLAFEKLFAHAQVDGGIATSKNFSRATEKAVRNFQQQEGLPVTGIVDAKTLTHISSIVSDQNPPDVSAYDDLSQQLDSISNLCPLSDTTTISDMAPGTSTPPDASSTDISTQAPSDTNSLAPGECPVGCIPQDQVPDCSSQAQDTAAPPADACVLPDNPAASSPSTTPQAVVIATSTPKSTISTSTLPHIVIPLPVPVPTSTPASKSPPPPPIKTATSTQTGSHK